MGCDIERGAPGLAQVRYLIRSAREADLPALEWMGVFTPHRHTIRDVWERSCEGTARMLVADGDGFPIGQAWIELPPQRHGIIWALRVLPGLRGSGIGSALLRSAESEIARSDRIAARLAVARDNIDALRLYLRAGYRPIGQQLAHVPGRAHDGAPRTELEEQLVLEKRIRGDANELRA